MQFEVHPIANIFPPMSDAEFQALKADIKQHGQREAIWLYEEKVIDGRHRLRACSELGIPARTEDYDGFDAVSFVVSLNLHRRHLSESQRGMVASRLENMPSGARTDLEPDANLHQVSRAKAAEMLNVSTRTVANASKVREQGADELVSAVDAGKVSVSAAATIAEASKEQQREIVARGEREILQAAKEIRANRLEERRAERIENIVQISRGNQSLDTSATFPVIYADPPWRYEHVETESRAIENQYPTMSLKDICELPVGQLAQEDCILFMWATSPKLAEAFEVLKAWGFTYRTCAVWDKQKIGMGYYFRQQHELLLVAAKGNLPTPQPADRPSSVFSFPRGEHSAKPHQVAEIIERMYPELPKVELFCRSPRPGWQVWGNQAKAA